MAVKDGDDVERPDGVIVGTALLVVPPVRALQIVVMRHDHRLLHILQVVGQVGFQKGQGVLRIVVLGRITNLGMRLIGGVQIQLYEVNPAPIPGVVQTVVGNVIDQAFL